MSEQSAPLCPGTLAAENGEEIAAVAHRHAMRAHHRLMLVLSVGAILAAFLLEVRSDGRVQVPGLPQFPLPATCGSRVWFGVECPGCGLTRSFIHLAHGEWQASLRVHRLGWLLALVVLAQIPYRLVALSRPEEYAMGRRAAQWFGYGMAFLLVANWLLKVTLWH